MPQIEAARKALRTSARRRLTNDRWRRRIREHLRAVREAITAGDATAATTALSTAASTLDRAARHHIIHPNAAARRKSRLEQSVRALAQK